MGGQPIARPAVLCFGLQLRRSKRTKTEHVLAHRAPSCKEFRPHHLPTRMYQVTRPVTTKTYDLKSEIDLANPSAPS
jgi:hypothetical protein